MPISALLVPDIGGKERRYMTNNTNYTDAPADIEQALDDATITSDFLPSPAELVRKAEKKEKITIAIDKHSLDLFKKYAKQHDSKYQTMINGVLGSYADKFLNR
jgi:predicted DNA binding CopG/RHH family protein